MTDSLDSVDATALAHMIRAGDVSAIEVVHGALERIAERDPALGAIVEVRADAALRDVAAGLPDGPLTGVPFVVKDLGATVAGMRNENGSRLYAGHVATADSELVARYRRAGLVIVATTKTPEFGDNASTEPVVGGPARNPHRLTHSTGGSSGGTAAAVASGMVPAGHGNDGGGSIRIPASMCALVGLKPTRGRTPEAPRLRAFTNPFPVHHALTRSVRDSALLLDVAAGRTTGAAYHAPAPPTTFVEAAATPPPRCRVALSTVRPDGTAADPHCADAAAHVAYLLDSLGHEITEATPPYPLEAMHTAVAGVFCVSSAAGIDARLAELGRPLRDDDIEPYARVLYERGRGMTGTEVVHALEAVEQVGWELGPFYEEFDLLVTPTLPLPVPPLGHLDTTDVEAMFRNAPVYGALTGVANITGQPAISLPMAADAEGLPIGVQLTAGFGREDLLLQVAAQLEQAAPWNQAPVWPPASRAATGMPDRTSSVG